MTPQRDKANDDAATGGDDVYGVSEPCELPDRSEQVLRHIRAAAKPMVSAAELPPPPPKWPMLSGIFTFPWYLGTLGSWMGISFGLIVTGLLTLFLLGPGMVLGLLAFRLLGPPVCAAGLLTLSYAASCCLNVIEETFHGWDSIETWPDWNWKEWVWSFTHITALVLQAALFGAGLKLITLSSSWLPMVLGTLVAFPFVLLGALAADAAWVPLSIMPVLRSLKRLWWAWAIFYLETAAMIVGWVILTVTGLRLSPWWVPFYSGPALAAVMLIYARLIGRLARMIGERTGS